jgi:hypothetical protein
MKVMGDRPSKLISWVANYVLLSHQIWSWSNQNTRKIRFLLVLWIGPILTLTIDHGPNHLVWWLITSWYIYMLTIMFLRWKTKKLNFLRKFSFYVMTSLNDVITSNFCWFGKFKSRAFIWGTTWYGNIFLKIWFWGKQISTRSESHEGQSWSTPKIKQLGGRPFGTITPSLELIW